MKVSSSGGETYLLRPKWTLPRTNTCSLLNPELKLEKKMKIRVEPGIFEWMKWEASKSTPAFMTRQELKEASFNVDPDYRWALPRLSAPPSPALVKELSGPWGKKARETMLKRDLCGGAVQWGRGVGPSSEHGQGRRGSVAQEQVGSGGKQLSLPAKTPGEVKPG